MDCESTDSTLAIAREFPEIVRKISSKRDVGVYDAMNRAIADTTDEWILFLGADDRLMPNFYSHMTEIWSEIPENTTVLYGDVYRPRKNTVYDGPFSKWKLVRRNICHQAILYKSEVLKMVPFDIRYRINGDHILNLDLMLRKYVFTYIPVCISHYEDMSDGLSRDRCDATFLQDRRALIKGHREWILYIFATVVDAKERIRSYLNRKLI